MAKLLAPFGEYLAKKNGSIAIIFMGQYSFERAANFRDTFPYTLVLPPNTSPLCFAWPVNGCKIYLCDTGYADESFIRFCAIILFGYGATDVKYIGRNRLINIGKGVLYE